MNKNLSNQTLKSRTVSRQAPKICMTEDQELISYLLLLRFGSYNDVLKLTPILNYTSIALIVKKPIRLYEDLYNLASNIYRKD